MAGSAFESIHLPDWVWQSADTDKALSSRNTGALFHLAKKYAGASQNRISAVTGIPQGRISDLMRGAGGPVTALDVFERIADGLHMPDHARMRLGLAPRKSSGGGYIEPTAVIPPSPPSGSLPAAASPAVIEGLREVLKAHIQADAVMGPLFLLPAVQSQIPVIERVCQVTRGADRAEALNFGSEFIEFCGWLHQDAGDFAGAMYWTDKALEYAMELGDQRITSYILMRKSNIATDDRDPSRALNLANTALKHADALTPRLRAVILRQRANAYALLKQRTPFEEDSEDALAQAAAGLDQEEPDRAGYCSPAYVEMEAGASWTMLGQPRAALPVFEESRAQMNGSVQLRDHALCLARLATAYACADEPDEALSIAEEALILAQSLGSARVIAQLRKLRHRMARWSRDPAVADLLRRLDLLVESFRSPSPRPEGVT